MKTLLLLVVGLLAACAEGAGQASVLATGRWLKIGVTATGAYRLDAAQLRQAGWAGLSPRHLQLYSGGGAMLPQANAAPGKPLRPVPIQVSTTPDGQLQSILFFGESPHQVVYDTAARAFTHRINVYSDTTFYFLTQSSQPGLRVQTAPTAAGATARIDRYTAYQFHEKDLFSRLRSGRERFGESFLVRSRWDVDFNTPGLLTDAPVRVRAGVLVQAEQPTGVSLWLNADTLGTLHAGGLPAERYGPQGLQVQGHFLQQLTAPQTGLRVGIRYSPGQDPTAQAWLDYLSLQTSQAWRWNGNALLGRLPAHPAALLPLQSAPGESLLWDVTAPLQPLALPLNAGTATLPATPGWQALLWFTPQVAAVPASLQEIASQEIFQEKSPQLLLLTPAIYAAEAERLASFRRLNDSLDVVVLSTEAVYNTLASGQPDPTALRDAVRFFYGKGRLKYVLLFGDASYDFRNIEKQNLAQGYVPTYESRQSLDPLRSYASDDYFGFLHQHEGEWAETAAGNQLLSVAVGRLPVQTRDEARRVVDKLIFYEKKRSDDRSRQLTLIADDADYNLHLNDTEQLARLTEDLRPDLQVEKIYLDAGLQRGQPPAQQAPVARRGVLEALSAGRLLVAYTGHGSPTDWAQEQVLTLGDMLRLQNADRRLPLLLTATCEFGRYDDPGTVSGGEVLLSRVPGGAIGLLSSTRPVYANSNFMVSEAFFRALLTTKNARLGDLFLQTKNNSLFGVNNRNFVLLGDPSMRLQLPERQLAIAGNDTLRAGERFGFSLAVKDTAAVTLWLMAPPQPLRTLGDEQTTPAVFTQRLSVWGMATLRPQNGVVSWNGTVPQEAATQPGRARVYAQAGGYTGLLDVPVGRGGRAGGTRPPDVWAGFTDSLRAGPAVGPSATLYIRLHDEDGILLTQEHPLTLTLDDSIPVLLHTCYRPQPGDPTQGHVLYTFTGLAVGRHQVQVSAWDGAGNHTLKNLTFWVENHKKSPLNNVSLMPNPFNESILFSFEHAFGGQDTELLLEVLDAAGRPVCLQRETLFAMPSPYTQLRWQPAALPAGLYLYRIRLTGPGGQQTASGRMLFRPN